MKKKETEKKNRTWLIIVGIIVVILFIPIISDSIKKQSIEVLSEKEIKEKLTNEESFILYEGDTKEVKKALNKLKDVSKEEYSIDYNVYSTSKSLTNKKVTIYVEGEEQKTYDKFDKDKLNTDIEVYYIGKIDESNRSYKVAENYTAYKNLVKSDVVTMAVFGRDNCFYCNKFKPVYNAVAEKYNIDIYFFDSLSYNSSDYTKIINMDLTVPAKCSSEGKEFKLSDGFGTPLTVFTQNNKVVDCISGYVNRSSLIEKLKSNSIISE